MLQTSVPFGYNRLMTDDGKFLTKARAWAARHHAGQVDKLGVPYLAHVGDVAGRVRDHGAIVEAIAWLHDLVEDTPVTLDDIETTFGPRIAAGVDALTRREGEGYFEAYLPRLERNRDAVAVKLADAAHNWGKIHLLEAREPKAARSLARRYRRVLETLGEADPVCHAIHFDGEAWG